MNSRTGLVVSALRLLLAVALAAVVVGVILVLAGVPVYATFTTVLTGAFGSMLAWQQTAVYGLEIGLCALAAIVAFRMGVWNVGADGQLIMGCIAATLVGLAIGPRVPGVLAVPAVVVAAMAAGAVWALGPALLKAFFGVNEVITTLMLNYVAALLLRYLLYGPMHDPAMNGFPYSRPLPPDTSLPSLATGFNLDIVFWMVAVATVAIIFFATVWGYEIKLAGSNPRAARYAGVNVRRNIVLAMVISGGVAGLAGLGDVLGSAHQLFIIDTQSYGYTGILVAWLVALNPVASVIVSVVYGGLIAGGNALKLTGTSPSIVNVIQAMVVLAALASGSFSLRKGKSSA